MSSKLTSKTLDLLIEQVLSEEINIGDDYNITNLRKKFNFKKNPKKLSPGYSGGDQDKRQAQIKKNLKGLVDQDKTPTNMLDKDDFKKAYTLGKDNDIYQTALNLYDVSSDDEIKKMSFDNEPSQFNAAPNLKLAMKGDAGSRRKFLNNAFKSKNFENNENVYVLALRQELINTSERTDVNLTRPTKDVDKSIIKLVNFLGSYVEGAAGTQKPADLKLAASEAFKVFDKLDRAERSDYIPTVDLPYTPVQQKDTTVPLKAIGKLDPSIIDTMKGFYDVDVSKLGISADLQNTLPGRFEVIAKFAELAKGAKTNKNQEVKTLKKLTPEELMSVSTVLKTMGSMFQTIQGASAGTVFEVFISLITGGVVKGGSGGAIDNLSGVNGDVYLSAKQYENKHGISQAIGKPLVNGGRGLLAACQKATAQKKKVWYISISKNTRKVPGGESKSLQSLGLKLIGLDVDDDANPTAFRIYDGNGDLHKTIPKESPDVAKPWTTGKGSWTFTAYTDEIDELLQIPIMDEISDNVETIDKMIAGALDQVGNDFLTAAKLAQNKLSGMKKDALSFSTVKGPAAATAGSNLRTEYINLKQQINNMLNFKGEGTTAAAGENLSQIAENKTKSLKDLDKLIEHVILNKMNK